MKQFKYLFLLIVLLSFAYISCLSCSTSIADNGINGGNSESGAGDSGSSTNPQNGRILVVYFSATNNTKSIAEVISSKTGGDLVEITPKVPYTSEDLNYNNSSSRSQTERRDDARPEIAESTFEAINMDDYSIIFIGHPIWNSYEPMIIRTFIEHYNGLDGKTIYTFSKSASSLGSTAFNSIKGRCKNSSDVKENIHFTNSNFSSRESILESKLTSLKLRKEDRTVSNRIKMSFNNNEIYATLSDNSATRDLISRLKDAPLTLEFSDYAGSEKIAYPSPALDVSNVSGCNPEVGDLTIYTPWKNIAAFYKKTVGYSDSLVLLGKIEGNGIEVLSKQDDTFNVIMELL